MDIRFITRSVHAWLDYPVAFTLMSAPFVLGLGSVNPAGKWLAVVAGVAALVLTLLTDHQFGVLRVLPYRVHLAVDFVVGVTFAIAPATLGLTGIDALFYWANAAAVLLVVGLHKPAADLAPAPAVG